MSVNKLTGTGVAIVTPFRKDGSVDFKSLEKLVNFLITKGTDYLVVLGTTGETPVLSKDEKQAILNQVIEINAKRIPLVLGLGGNNTAELVNSLEHGNFEGVDAILSVTPYYNKPNQDGLYQHYKAIALASPLPVVLYNVPGRTGANMNEDTCLRLAREFPKQIVAVKEASANLPQIMNILKDKPAGFEVISGDDALTFPMVSLGGAGVISVAANAFPAEFSKMVKLARNGKTEEARAIHFKLLPVINLIFAEGSPAGVKAFLDVMGIVPNYLRLPLVPVSKDLYKRIEVAVREF
ncbi:MAG: 4-hydroxy-tetrahydrodipicolinate synthase [Bacteroidales bacterium]|nr:4-hydroxy-tetrahydrodipicolinate synthase [Bacteroidales bacterium]MCB9000027.1 4-hydroxy-tetrahydrodipicolinate synthase [Bacteroidales bacterium]MCB9013601.1 4-hydroxy-tetrahydrodipicolinate synthase [Bacteroidales bacterium]